MSSNHVEVLEKAITFYGEENQVTKAIEEMAELTVALLHRHRVDGFKNVKEELADVWIMMAQLEIIFGRFDDILKQKIERLENRMSSGGDSGTCSKV